MMLRRAKQPSSSFAPFFESIEELDDLSVWIDPVALFFGRRHFDCMSLKKALCRGLVYYIVFLQLLERRVENCSTVRGDRFLKAQSVLESIGQKSDVLVEGVQWRMSAEV